MRTVSVVGGIAAILISASAMAADLPLQKPLPTPVAARGWTGFYVGLNAGYTWTDNGQVNVLSSFVPGSQNPFFPRFGTYTGEQSAFGASGTNLIPNAGFIGGAQLGYNFALNNHYVFGVEADFQGIGGRHHDGSSSSVIPLLGTFETYLGLTPGYAPGEIFATSLNSDKRTDYFGTIRGRLGWLSTPALLLYGTGGLAYGHVSSSTSIVQTNNDLSFAGGNQALALYALSQSSGNYSRTLIGWAAGGGGEWIFLPNWSAKLEYLYYDLGSVDYALGPVVTTGGSAFGTPIQAIISPHASTRFDGHIVRVGLNYRFN
jgi:outer membrane immunogenic protein